MQNYQHKHPEIMEIRFSAWIREMYKIQAQIQGGPVGLAPPPPLPKKKKRGEKGKGKKGKEKGKEKERHKETKMS